MGYARVSSASQSLEIQVEQLTAAGCDRIWQEKVSGSTLDPRAELRAMLAILRAGDEFYVTRLDRLARSVVDMLHIVQSIEKIGASLHVLQQAIETKSPGGRMFLTMIAAFAEFENEIRRARQTEGIQKARSVGAYLNHRRGPSFDPAEIVQLWKTGLSQIKVAKKLGCTRNTVYRHIRDWKKEQGAPN